MGVTIFAAEYEDRVFRDFSRDLTMPFGQEGSGLGPLDLGIRAVWAFGFIHSWAKCLIIAQRSLGANPGKPRCESIEVSFFGCQIKPRQQLTL